MLQTPELVQLIATERVRDLRASADARGPAPPAPARDRLARSLRGLADRLDPAPASRRGPGCAVPGCVSCAP